MLAQGPGRIIRATMLQGSTGQVYAAGMGDKLAQSPAISAPTAASLIISGVSNKQIYIYMLAYQTAVADSDALVNCGVGAGNILPVNVPVGKLAGEVTRLWTSDFGALIVPLGNSVFGVVAPGATNVHGYFVAYYAQR